MGTLTALFCADAVARVAAAVEAEDNLSFALYQEQHCRPGYEVRACMSKLDQAVRAVHPGDIEVWEIHCTAMDVWAAV
jgi:hypothetical protein